MPKPLSAHERQAFLAEPHIGVLSVAGESGQPPLAMPLWYGYQPGGMLSFFTGTQGRKARKTELIQRAGVVSLLVQREEPPYKYVAVEGIVVTIDKPPSFAATCPRKPREPSSRQSVRARRASSYCARFGRTAGGPPTSVSTQISPTASRRDKQRRDTDQRAGSRAAGSADCH